MRPQKLPHAEAGARKRKMAAARQAARWSRLRQAEKDAGARAEGGKGKERMEEKGGRGGVGVGGRRGVGGRTRRGN